MEGDSIGIVDYLGTIPAGAALTALDETRLTLQTTYEGSFDLSAVSFYLTGGSQIRLSALDARPELSSGSQLTPTTGSILDLISGKLLIVRSEGDHEIQVAVGANSSSLVGFGAVMMGFIVEDGTQVVDCLVGQCQTYKVNGDPVKLMSGQRLSLVEVKQEGIEVIPEGILQGWDKLCDSCLSEQ